jgi:hypothetical protein
MTDEFKGAHHAACEHITDDSSLLLFSFYALLTDYLTASAAVCLRFTLALNPNNKTKQPNKHTSALGLLTLNFNTDTTASALERI